MDKQVEKALTVTLERFENGQWIHGTEHYVSDEGDRYCLVGSLKEQLIGTGKYPMALEALGFSGYMSEWSAIDFNDSNGRGAVIKRIKESIPDPQYRRLHKALDASRLAHAERDIGKNVPDFAPAAWYEMDRAATHSTLAKV